MHQPRQQDEHFIAIEMTETIVDPLEEIDIENSEPDVLVAVGSAPRLAPDERREAKRFAFAWPQRLRQGPVERLAIEQAGQFVIFAVIEDLQMVLIDAQQARQHFALILSQRLGMVDFQKADDASDAGDGEDVTMLTGPAAPRGAGALES